jgi:uncharacterized protein (TIGR00730 family)
MPHSSSKGKGGALPPGKGRSHAADGSEGKPVVDNTRSTQAPVPHGQAAGPAALNGNGNGNHNGHDRRRSGRVTFRPKVAAMLQTQSRTEDERLLSPRHRPAFLDSDPWRSLRILSEFVEGFDALAGVGKAVTIFGSARVHEDDPWYAKARELAGNLAREGFAVITGGGPGIMEAANRGCHEAGGLSIGCNIELPHEQAVNQYVDLGVEFRYFFARKTMFVKYADAFAIFPGGFGTLDELFESLTLIQTGKIRHFPVVLVGTEYWSGLLDWLRTEAIGWGNIGPEDLELMKCTDDMDEACRWLTASSTRRAEEAAVNAHAANGASSHL